MEGRIEIDLGHNGGSIIARDFEKLGLDIAKQLMSALQSIVKELTEQLEELIRKLKEIWGDIFA